MNNLTWVLSWLHTWTLYAINLRNWLRKYLTLKFENGCGCIELTSGLFKFDHAHYCNFSSQGHCLTIFKHYSTAVIMQQLQVIGTTLAFYLLQALVVFDSCQQLFYVLVFLSYINSTKTTNRDSIGGRVGDEVHW